MGHIKSRARTLAVLAVALLLGTAIPGISGGGSTGPVVAPSRLEASGDQSRRGAFEHEVVLTPSNVASITQKGSYTADARIWGQPLFAQGVVIGGVTYDLMILATMGNHLWAFDVAGFGNAIWETQVLATTRTTYPGYSGHPDPDIYSEAIGCLATPAIDKTLGVVFAVCTDSGPGVSIYKISLTTGAVLASAAITGTATGTGDPTGGDRVSGGVVTFYPDFELARSGLAIANGNVYITFASYADNHPWHGWVFSYDEATVTRQAALCITPNGYGGSIWGGAPPVDGNGNLYVTTGNGDYNGTTNFANSIIKLSPALAILDWWTPSNFATLEANDLDIASVRPMLVPGSTQVVSGGKEYKLYSVDSTCMGHLQGSSMVCPAAQVFAVSGFSPTEFNGLYSETMTQGNIYFATSTDHTYGFSHAGGVFNSSGFHDSATRPFPGDALSASSNGTLNAIVWAVTTDIGEGQGSTHIPVQGTLRAFDASTLAQLYSDAGIGVATKFNPPAIYNGRVFVPSGSKVFVYGL